MNARLAKLEALLARVQNMKGAARQRKMAASGPSVGGEMELDEPSLSEPPDSLAPDSPSSDTPSAHLKAGERRLAAAATAVPEQSQAGYAAAGDSLVPDSLNADAEDDDVLDLDAENVLIEEAPPESGSGPVGEAKSLEEAMRKTPEGPPLTPPPESGEELAPPVSVPRDRGPTMEQLGNTISLEDEGESAFELEEPTRAMGSVPAAEDKLSADIPTNAPRTIDELVLPENAREELERVRLGQKVDVQPVATDRPVISTNVVAFVSSMQEFHPESFDELLDESLKL